MHGNHYNITLQSIKFLFPILYSLSINQNFLYCDSLQESLNTLVNQKKHTYMKNKNKNWPHYSWIL